MKTYTIVGNYNGKILMKVKAAGYYDAIKKIENAEEDEYEIMNPSAIDPLYPTLEPKS